LFEIRSQRTSKNVFFITLMNAKSWFASIKIYIRLQNYFGDIFYGDIFEVETDQNLAKVGSKSWPFQ